MKELNIILAILLFSTVGYSQSAITKSDSTIEAFKYYLIRNTRYPAVAAENDVQGDMVIGFKLGKDEKISEVKIVKSLSKECDSAALLSIRKYPGMLLLPSKVYTIGLHYFIIEGETIHTAPVPFNSKLYKHFLLETNITRVILSRKK
jgi:hypothetical protein